MYFFLIRYYFLLHLVQWVSLHIFRPSILVFQGDPLSPFIITIAVEGCGRKLKAIVSKGNIKGLHFFGRGLLVSNQQFVYGTMLVGVPTIKQSKAFSYVLDDFMEASSTSINFSKS